MTNLPTPDTTSNPTPTAPMPASEQQTIHIMGVVHSNERNPVAIPDQSPSPLSAVYHEFAAPEEDGIWQFIVYSAVTPPTALRTLLKHAGDAVARTKCEEGAMNVADREGLDVQYMGASRLCRAKQIWYHASIWIAVLGVLYWFSGWLTVSGSVLFAISFIVFLMPVTTWDEHRQRERHLGQSIAGDLNSRTDQPAIVVLGADHTEGVASHLEKKGYRTAVNYIDG